MRKLFVLATLALLASASPSRAQNAFPTPNPNVNAPGVVEMCVGGDGRARACDPLVPRSVIVVNPTPATPYPTSAWPITGNATGSTGAVVGTLAAQPFKTTYICGFDVSAIGGTAAIGPVTIAGTVSGSLVYQLSSSAAGVTLSRAFTPCIPASAVNTAITITTTADGTATAVDVNAWGFQL